MTFALSIDDQPLLVKLLTPTAEAPERNSDEDVGYDLHADLLGPVRLPPGTRRKISTGVAVAISPGLYGRIAPRSGLATKKGIDVLGGVVDPGYRGELFVTLLNTSTELVELQHRDRIAQLILERVATPRVQVVRELPPSLRGDAGFGSTGR